MLETYPWSWLDISARHKHSESRHGSQCIQSSIKIKQLLLMPDIRISQISQFQGIVELKYGSGSQCRGLGIKNILELDRYKDLRTPQYPYSGTLKWRKSSPFRKIIIAKKVDSEENVRRIFQQLVFDQIKERFPDLNIKYEIEIRYPVISISIPFKINLEWVWSNCYVAQEEFFRKSAVRYVPQSVHQTEAKVRFHKYATKNHQLDIWNSHLVQDKLKLILDLVEFLKSSNQYDDPLPNQQHEGLQSQYADMCQSHSELDQYIQIDYQNDDLYVRATEKQLQDQEPSQS